MMLSALFLACSTLPQADTIALTVDAREAARGVFHVRETIPAPPGELKLYFPKYIPGEHGPSGRINDMMGLHFQASGKELEWKRDPEDVFTFRVTVPQNTDGVTVTFDHRKGHGEGSQNLCRLNWHEVLLYRADAPADKQSFRASLTIPEGWKVSTALKQDGAASGTANYGPVALTRLIDSPCLMGRYYKQVDVTPPGGGKSTLEIYGEDPGKINLKPEDVAGMKRLNAEFEAQAGGYAYRSYQYLLSFSPGSGAGLEHHESSEDGMGEDTLASDKEKRGLWELLGHEGFHSWNGKYRRPAGLSTSDYQKPYHNELLWVYEGMTQFYGQVMPTRAGLWTQEYFRDNMALTAQRLKNSSGRNWRTIAETTFLPLMPNSWGPQTWTYERRSVDYYYEMTMVWLEVDMRLRALTNGAKSMSDFCRIFHGGASGKPELKPYDFDEVARTLDQVAPYDWAGLLKERIYTVQAEPPLKAFEMAGWRYVETDEPTKALEDGESESTWLLGSIGITLKGNEIEEMVPGMAADKAGLAPGWKIASVNGLKFSTDAIKNAIKATSNGGKLDLMVERDRDVQPYSLDYKGGLRYPHLVRIEGVPDRMADLLKSLAKG